MTDIYVGSRRPPWVPILIVLTVVMLVGFLVFRRTGHKNPEEPAPAPVLDASDAPDLSSAPPADESPDVSAAPPERLPSLEDIQELIQNENLHAARRLGFERLNALPRGAARLSTEAVLGDLHVRMAFHKIPMQEKVTHVVSRGDTIGKLAKQYNTTPELIAISNGIERNLIRLGETLRILQGEYTAVVNKTRNDMVVTLNDRFFKRYSVGTGTHNSTPAGEYVITLRLKHPVWYRPDGKEFPYGHPENLLGTHYLKLNTPGIGLHGTWEPDTVGSQSSAGCVRLRNEMIEELYNLLPEGTSVRIENGS